MPKKATTSLPAGVESLDAVARRFAAQRATAKRAAQPDDGNDDGDPSGQHTDGRDADGLVDAETNVNDPNDGGDEHQELMDGLTGVSGDRAQAASIQRSAVATSPAPEVSYYAPITRIDREKREIIGVATAEVKDAYRTVIGYEASKDAFARWAGNIREMHQSKAVGRALEITPDDANRRILVRARISKGAEDTWQKILDGTLTGFSIGGKNGTWSTRTIDGEELPYLERYDQAELSVVDNPACPVAAIEVVRADGVATAVLASREEMDLKPSLNASASGESVERKGARVSKETQDALHTARDHALSAAKHTMSTCACDECSGKLAALSDSDDGDGDMDSPEAERARMADIVRSVVADTLSAQIAPTMARVNALLAADAARTDAPEAQITRRVDDLDAQLSRIYALVEKIAAQPADGGPVLHGAAVDKRLATQQQGGTASRGTDADAIARAMQLGFAPPSDPNEAIRAAAKLVRPIPR